MSDYKNYFKKFIGLIGSGENTSRGMSRDESAEALELILKGLATPTQIGAFFVAHRIRRPEPKELAGMIDTYIKLGPRIKTSSKKAPTVTFGMPFDGRNSSCPIYPFTVLILLSAGQPVVLHGGRRMPVKYGISQIELFRSIGLSLDNIAIKDVQKGFDQNDFALIHQPDHFQLADNLIKYRDEIGKRPPIASMELLWTACEGESLLISGFVHKPTEERAQKTLEILGREKFISVKGLEGSTDLSVKQRSLIGKFEKKEFNRIILKAKDYGFNNNDPKWKDINSWRDNAFKALKYDGELIESVIWNGGVYLWLTNNRPSLQEGIEYACKLINSGVVEEKLKSLIEWKSSI
tara:strand:+ start:1387 stop:2436 length:1050 start_codon:yes stop_codon:yes gene_type:complete